MALKYSLITKDEERSLALTRLLKNKSHEVHFAPLFEIKYLKPDIKMIDFGAVIITSPNAIKSFLDLDIDKSIEVFSVGKITSYELKRAGFVNIKTSLDQNALSLKNLIVSSYRKKQEILYLCADQVTLDFQEELAKFDIKVAQYVSYKAIPKSRIDCNLKEINFDYIFVFSRRSAKLFLELVSEHTELKDKFKLAKILCLSNKIADEFKNSDFKKIGNFQELEILQEYYSL